MVFVCAGGEGICDELGGGLGSLSDFILFDVHSGLNPVQIRN